MAIFMVCLQLTGIEVQLTLLITVVKVDLNLFFSLGLHHIHGYVHGTFTVNCGWSAIDDIIN